MNYIDAQIIDNQKITSDIFVLTVQYHDVKCNPGQFFMLKSWDTELTLMRPISIFLQNEDSISFMYRVVGKGTKQMTYLTSGDRIKMLGPCGNGYPIESLSGKIALVGGGVGIPPLCLTAKVLQENGGSVDAYLGFKNETFAIDDFNQYCANVFVSTEDGSNGHKGFVTDMLKPENYDAVLTCGPEIMMCKVASMSSKVNTRCLCSLENRMACGIGACLGCSIKTKIGMQRVCKEGPVFDSSNLFFE